MDGGGLSSSPFGVLPGFVLFLVLFISFPPPPPPGLMPRMYIYIHTSCTLDITHKKEVTSVKKE